VSRGFALDTGALIAMENPAKQRRLAALFGALGEDGRIIVSAGCIAQTWRGSPRQAPLAMLLRRRNTKVEEITTAVAKTIGIFLGRHPDSDDIVDAHVAMLATHHGVAVITSDPGDLASIDPKLHIIPI
jgi:predicted nucleic acid-binding protein